MINIDWSALTAHASPKIGVSRFRVGGLIELMPARSRQCCWRRSGAGLYASQASRDKMGMIPAGRARQPSGCHDAIMVPGDFCRRFRVMHHYQDDQLARRRRFSVIQRDLLFSPTAASRDWAAICNGAVIGLSSQCDQFLRRFIAILIWFAASRHRRRRYFRRGLTRFLNRI